MDDLTPLVASWPDPDRVSLAVTDGVSRLGSVGDTGVAGPIASISKVLVACAVLVAVEEGTVDLDEAAGPPGATVRHLLAHAAGYAFDDDTLQAPMGTRRIYSNTGIDVVAAHLADRAAMPFEQYQREAVIDPLGMAATALRGSPAQGVWSNVDDLEALARELLSPSVFAAATLREATTPQFPDLAGVLPGFGRFDPNPWGLGIEIRGHKQPHWCAPGAAPQTFGHFGGSGTYLWVDPTRRLAAVAIAGTAYGPWANAVWPVTNQAIVDRYSP